MLKVRVHLLNYIELKIQQMREQSQEDIIQPSNTYIKVYQRSQQVKLDNSREKRRGLTPTEFLNNTNEYGRLKESSESIFSFGTSKRKFHSLLTKL
jgi:hypothetical protein